MSKVTEERIEVNKVHAHFPSILLEYVSQLMGVDCSGQLIFIYSEIQLIFSFMVGENTQRLIILGYVQVLLRSEGSSIHS